MPKVPAKAARAAALVRKETMQRAARGERNVAPFRVVIAYAREDQAVARALFDFLALAGAAPWWDQLIPAGDDFGHAIEKAIADAQAVIVIWSVHAARSPIVVDEATRANRQGKLISTGIAGFATDGLPLGFGRINTMAVDDRERLLVELGTRGVDLD